MSNPYSNHSQRQMQLPSGCLWFFVFVTNLRPTEFSPLWDEELIASSDRIVIPSLRGEHLSTSYDRISSACGADDHF